MRNKSTIDVLSHLMVVYLLGTRMVMFDWSQLICIDGYETYNIGGP